MIPIIALSYLQFASEIFEMPQEWCKMRFSGGRAGSTVIFNFGLARL